MRTVLIAMGGNLGNVSRTMADARELLRSTPGCTSLQMSRLYHTQPVGVDAGGAFINGAVALSSDLNPLALLERLQEIESLLGRTRTTHWGPRTIDLDLVGMQDLVLDTPRLRLPHPACWYRRFVLDPVHDVAPEWIHPVFGESVIQLRQRLLIRPLPVGLLNLSAAVLNRLKEKFGEQIHTYSISDPSMSDPAVVIGSTHPAGFQVALPAGDESVPEQSAAAILQAALDEPCLLNECLPAPVESGVATHRTTFPIDGGLS